MAAWTPTGHPLETAREAAGLTVQEVATALGRDTASVRRWEKGITQPRRAQLIQLAALYDLEPAALVV